MSNIITKDPLLRKMEAQLKEYDNPEIRITLDSAVSLSKKYKRIDMCFLQMVKRTKSSKGATLVVPSFAVLPYNGYKDIKTCYFGSRGYGYFVSAQTKGIDIKEYNRNNMRYIFKEQVNLHSLKNMSARDINISRNRYSNLQYEQNNGFFFEKDETDYSLIKRLDRYDQKNISASYHVNISPDKRIPPTIDAYVEEKKCDFNELFIVWEVDEWNIPSEEIFEAPEYKGDPLVIGEKDGLYYLITQWDTTKLESYIVSEFVT